ncbi:RNA polymerase sigma factor [Engelhardtia mirabilis]|uniref:RNA polymerase sigma factor SigY n=1 Tax=Engelhardtia mirabilis TaxID=2528011 RepID=A0A518BEK1_9BACT|nr:RNA polymerase sigma factor SigY [Planctomycetes bacterium Pla133]QDU99743.1 RNA polymerase sigma factor SigY [Planctomycetes bacterium Pla86]
MLPDDANPIDATARADAALVSRVMAGDVEARAEFELRARCVPRIANWLNRRMSSPLTDADVDDVAQSALLVLWRKLPEYEGRARIETWAFTVVRFELLNAARRRQRSRLTGAIDVAEIDRPLEAEADLYDDDDRARLGSALARLDESKRTIVELKHLEGLTFPEIGERLQISENTARTRYYRGLRQLKAALEPGAEADPH